MKILILAFNLVQLLVYCNGDRHSSGRFKKDYNHLVSERVLINDTNNTPKNYVILYTYFSSFYDQVQYIHTEKYFTSHSRGRIRRKRGFITEPYGKFHVYVFNFNGTIHIDNALDVKATLKIYGFRQKLEGLPPWLDVKKSFAIIYKRNANQSLTSSGRNSIGKRQEGDELLHFETRNVTNVNRFPSRSFEYSGGEFITYVGFSFNSPTAMALLNTSYIGEREFNAVVYDMNTEHFVANISVYGIKGLINPNDFVPLI